MSGVQKRCLILSFLALPVFLVGRALAQSELLPPPSGWHLKGKVTSTFYDRHPTQRVLARYEGRFENWVFDRTALSLVQSGDNSELGELNVSPDGEPFHRLWIHHGGEGHYFSRGMRRDAWIGPEFVGTAPLHAWAVAMAEAEAPGKQVKKKTTADGEHWIAFPRGEDSVVKLHIAESGLLRGLYLEGKFEGAKAYHRRILFKDYNDRGIPQTVTHTSFAPLNVELYPYPVPWYQVEWKVEEVEPIDPGVTAGGLVPRLVGDFQMQEVQTSFRPAMGNVEADLQATKPKYFSMKRGGFKNGTFFPHRDKIFSFSRWNVFIAIGSLLGICSTVLAVRRLFVSKP